MLLLKFILICAAELVKFRAIANGDLIFG